MVQWPAARAKVQGGKADGGSGFEPHLAHARLRILLHAWGRSWGLIRILGSMLRRCKWWADRSRV